MPDDINPNPFGLSPPDDVALPWDWVPKEWSGPAPATPNPHPQLQPGLGIPTSAIDAAAAAAAAAPPTAPAPAPLAPALAADEVDPSSVKLGFPHPPADEPTPPELAYSGNPNAGAGLQPGLGIPVDMFDAAAAQAPEIPMPHVDAISGVDGVPPPETEPGLDVIARAGKQIGRHVGDLFGLGAGDIEMEGDDFSNPETRRATIEQMTTPELAGYMAEHEEARRQFALAKQTEAATQAARDAEADQKNYIAARDGARAKRAQVEAEAMRLAQEPEPERETADVIRGVLMGMAGGLMQNFNGGRNIGLDLIDKEIDAAALKFQRKQVRAKSILDVRRGQADQQLADAGTDLAQISAYRAASWQRVVQQIELQQGMFDREGTSFLRYETVKRDAKAQIAKGATEYEEAEAKRLEAEGKNKLALAKQLEVMRKNDIDAANEKARIKNDTIRAGSDAARAGADVRKTNAEVKELERQNEAQPVDELRRLYPSAPAELFDRPQSMKEFEKRLDAQGKIANTNKTNAEVTTKQTEARLESSGAGGSAYSIGDQEGNALRQKDGKVFEIKDSSDLRRSRELMTAAKNVRRIADLVTILRDKDGGASEIIGSPEYQELQSLMSQVDFETFKGYGLGAPSEGDKAMSAGVRGGKDPTSFLYDASAGFQEYARGLEEKANEELRTHGYDGDPVKLKRHEKILSKERNEKQNTDVWYTPDDLRREGVRDEGVLARARDRAAQSADTMAKQSSAPSLKIMASEVRARLASKEFSDEQAKQAMESIRREYRRRLTKMGPLDRARFGPAAAYDDDRRAMYMSLNPEDFSDELIDTALSAPLPAEED